MYVRFSKLSSDQTFPLTSCIDDGDGDNPDINQHECFPQFA